MRADLERNPDRAAALCCDAQHRLLDDVTGLTTAVMRSASRLPGWTIGHVLTHVARNADAHARRLSGMLRGADVPKYESGDAQRRAEIDAGAQRTAGRILADLRDSNSRLEEVLARCVAASWPHGHFRGGSGYRATACPAHRLREVEMHHVDLGLGYAPADWPDEYVAWDLPVLLASVPERLAEPGDRRRLMAWLAGRGPLDPGVRLDPW
jgi:maleylpyruvate isomerase